MKSMFNKCESLQVLDLSNFNTDEIIEISHMFKDCLSLEDLNISGFNEKTIQEDKDILEGCSSLKAEKVKRKK